MSEEPNTQEIGIDYYRVSSLSDALADTIILMMSGNPLAEEVREKIALILEGYTPEEPVEPREIELQKGATHIQWRYVGELMWTDLIAISELTGAQGEAGAPGTTINVPDDMPDFIPCTLVYNGSWPNRSTATSDPDRVVIWIGNPGGTAPATMADNDVWTQG